MYSNWVKCVSPSKIHPEFWGQLWLFRIFMKMRSYPNKMYNTVFNFVVADVESEFIQMLSICLATPLTPLTLTYQGGCAPNLASVLCYCFTYTIITAVKTPVKPTKKR